MVRKFKRSARISDLIAREISEMFLRGQIKDPRVSSVNVTEVRVSDDMGHAKIFFASFQEDCDIERTLDGLRNATGYIKTSLAKKLKMKKMPEIEFQYDDLVERRARIESILKDVSNERD